MLFSLPLAIIIILTLRAVLGVCKPLHCSGYVLSAESNNFFSKKTIDFHDVFLAVVVCRTGLFLYTCFGFLSR